MLKTKEKEISIAVLVKNARKEKGMSQLKLSKELEYSREAICAWENGTREPSFDTLILIAKYFGLTTDYLL